MSEEESYYNYITTENVEDELKKLKIIDDYDSDQYEHVNWNKIEALFTLFWYFKG